MIEQQITWRNSINTSYPTNKNSQLNQTEIKTLTITLIKHKPVKLDQYLPIGAVEIA